MGRRKRKKGDLYLALAVLFLLPFILNPNSVKTFFTSLFELIVVVSLTSAFGFILYVTIFKSKRNYSRHQFNNPEVDVRKNRVKDKRDLVSDSLAEKNFFSRFDSKKDTVNWSDELIGSLEWKRFEELCAGYFIAKGYKTKLSRIGADGGIDIYLYKDSYSSTKAFAIVQCKAWNTYKVGVKPIRELFGVMTAEKAPLGIFITSGSYTKEAEGFSDGKPLKLLSGSSLLKLISNLPEENQQLLLKKITKGDYITPSCPSCGTKMIERTSYRGNNTGNKFWGCENYPRCKNTLKMKIK